SARQRSSLPAESDRGGRWSADQKFPDRSQRLASMSLGSGEIKLIELILCPVAEANQPAARLFCPCGGRARKSVAPGQASGCRFPPAALPRRSPRPPTS